MISPIEFIPIAEETGLIIPIGKWIVETVCKQINSWDNQELHIPHIAINISAKQFHQADFVSMLVHTVFEHHIKPGRVMLEITEGVFLGNLEEAVDKMNALKQSGFTFAIDDFGTGYSSLTYLKRLPFDQLKIDQSFVRGLINNTTDAAIVKAIIVMAKSMNLNLIAEGVETEEHLSYLSDFGCHEYQGYYFSKPLAVEQLSEYIKDRMLKNLKI
jgi:EAL domain-containing protein (putative c-di-GMP-specific phosphodiesterase class I)